MPETGVLAPERMFVAVRAMAPVAGIPPNSGDTIFAMPCAANSMFELWRSPLIPSATTADSRLSTAASRATVNAEGNKGRICAAWKDGRENCGNPCGIPPNLLPIVSTGRWKTATAQVAMRSARMEPGMRFVSFGQNKMIARDAIAMVTVCHWIVAACSTSIAMRGRNSLGTGGVFRPKKSLIWVDAIRSAMPLVKPIVTGRGMYLTAVPSPVSP